MSQRSEAPSAELAREIDELLREAAERPGLISLAGGFPAAEAMPADSLSEAASAVLAPSANGRALQYDWPEGRRGLREWVAARLKKRGAQVDPEDVVITAGAQQALALATDRLVEEGGRVLVPSLCYAGALSLLRGRGAELVTAADAERLACAYVMPGVENPCGSDPVHNAATELLGLNVPIIADEAYGELRFDRRAPTLLLRDRARVFHVGSFSKTVSPGLRIGWLVAPAGERPHVLEEKQETDLQASTLTQSLLLQWLRTTDYDEHVSKVSKLYERRAHALVDALKKRFPSFQFALPEGGFCLWVDTQSDVSETALLRAAIDQGVSYDAGSHFRSLPDQEMATSLRLCFSNCTEEQLQEAAARLEKAFREASRSR